jgi:hypothetical protein
VPVVVFGSARRLPPPRESHPRRPALTLLAALLVALVLGAVLVDRVGADEERYEPASRSGRDAVLELAERHFPPQLVPWAMRTAGCETGYRWNLDAHSEGYDRSYRTYYSFWGPWQVDAVTWGPKAADLFGGPLSDPDVGAAMASWIATNLGIGHWPVCGRGGW